MAFLEICIKQILLYNGLIKPFKSKKHNFLCFVIFGQSEWFLSYLKFSENLNKDYTLTKTNITSFPSLRDSTLMVDS